MTERCDRTHDGCDVIITLGNEIRGDDGAGVAFGRLVDEHPGLTVVCGAEAPENVTGLVAKRYPERIVIADAFEFGGKPGERIVVPESRIGGVDISTHASLRLFIDFLKIVTEADIHILGFQPKETTFGEGLSDEVTRAVDEAARVVNETGGIDALFDGRVKGRRP